MLALATEILKNVKDPKLSFSLNGEHKTSNGGIRLCNGRELKAWWFDNPNNEKTKMLKDETVMRWCTNDCHPKPMWCGRSIFLNKAEYAASNGGKPKDKKEVEPFKKPPISDDFKIALPAMTSSEDYETLSQFLKGN
mmetsp:Transcript_6488/g.9409  ORF Transcript_6488/g.9409 Transcript_6488/m.9409 type:complete len:137 (-) Transcript_6488:42-452(-)